MNFRAKYLPAKKLVAAGWREGLLEELVEGYKYGPVRAVSQVLAELLDEVVPGYQGTVVVVPLPTIARHVRERGFDHTRLIAKELARRRGWRCQQVLTRTADTVQVGADRAARLEQAKRAYGLKRGVALDPQTTYVLLDDVWTTGASMRAAEKLLRAAGAKKIRRVVIAVSQ